ncbi:MAG: leucyl/phenylalanyl-tRNA--protein transferase [Vitreoscilla sp.]|nr:leucyl/phenylalanyl-tRNA--protein transferase [Vitreoscilla sp.]
MQLPWLLDDTPFPPTAGAQGPDSGAPGLLAAGADLSPPRLLAAYRQGIFPWFGAGQPVLWWSTDPRMVLRASDFKLSRSLRKVLQRFLRTPGCEIRFDHAFEAVVGACASSPREGQSGTWILPEMVRAYTALHRLGHAHSIEIWIAGELAGGLYGINLGRMFFGESMFSRQADASKIALASLVAFCRREGIELIDCQQETSHLASLGARPIPRAAFEAHLKATVDQPRPAHWAYDADCWAHLGLNPSAPAADNPT